MIFITILLKGRPKNGSFLCNRKILGKFLTIQQTTLKCRGQDQILLTMNNETSLNTRSQNKSALDEESFRESIASDERVRAAPIERPSKRCECDCHPLLPGQVSDMCTCKCDACNAMGTPRHRFNEVYEDWPDDPCTSTHVQPVHQRSPASHTQVPSLRNTSTQTETLECQSCGGSQVQRARHERVPWEEPERVQLVAPEESHAASTTYRTILQFRLVPPQTGPLFTAQKESPTNLRPVTRLYRVDRDGDDELEEYVERSPHHIRNPKGKRRSLISTSSEGSVVTCRRGTDRKDSWLVFKVVEGVS
ncbi:unnamed protein product [Timema podura]|uniref:Uncharacterized protein n=1 Tax=Timema podura TaxID=61482 RepID=A0ABN7P699_TIMPD|nr:unnamed protein product [Timema podura]